MKRIIPLLVLLALGSAHAFLRSKTSSGVPIKWTTNCIDYRLNKAGSVDMTFSEAELAVTDSFDAWQEVACTDTRLTYRGTTDDTSAGFNRNGGNRNIVVWRDREGTWPHQRDVIALTTVTFCTEAGGACPFVGAILDADIELNGEQFTFTNTGGRPFNRFDLRNTLTHEAGHFLGLDHSANQQATMFASAPPGERTKASLHADDIEGICDIQPAREEGPECLAAEGADPVDSEDGCTQTGGSAPGASWPLWALAALAVRRRRTTP